MTSSNGTAQIFRLPNGLDVQADIAGSSATLAQFYTGYDRAFILPGEKEELEGFNKCLAMNFGGTYKQLSSIYGPYREVVFNVFDGKNFVGGANFICYLLPAKNRNGATNKSGVTASYLALNLNYIFVNGEQRGRGYFRKVLAACPIVAVRFLLDAVPVAGRGEVENAPVLIFTEQNDPIRMDPDDYALDSRHTGLDQVDRLQMWARLGARVIDFPYAQPPLSDNQEAFDDLVLAVIGANGNKLSSCLLEEHLTRFFAISVLKGAALQSSSVASTQLQRLATQCDSNIDNALYDAGAWAQQNRGVDFSAMRAAQESLITQLRALGA